MCKLSFFVLFCMRLNFSSEENLSILETNYKKTSNEIFDKEDIEFLTDQKSTRKMCITDDIDMIYRNNKKLEMFIEDKYVF